jgi:hypothetical protein
LLENRINLSSCHLFYFNSSKEKKREGRSSILKKILFVNIMPPAADADLAVKPVEFQQHDIPIKGKQVPLTNSLDGPLKYSGSLDQYKSFEVTPIIGREYPELQLSDILSDDAKIRDLAILGVFFIFWAIQVLANT